MILGNIKDSDRYNAIHPYFELAFEYLKNNDLSNHEAGVIELKGKDLFIIVQDSDLRPTKDAKLEVHNKYIDIQLPLSRLEKMGWAPRSQMKNPLADFDQEKDIQFFDDKGHSFVEVCPDEFLIFFPEDAHAPCIGEGKVRKIVVKIRQNI